VTVYQYFSPRCVYLLLSAINFDELIVVADRFHVNPLLPILSGNGRCYILNTQPKGGAGFFEGTKQSIREIEIEAIPKSLAEAFSTMIWRNKSDFIGETARGGERGSMLSGAR